MALLIHIGVIQFILQKLPSLLLELLYSSFIFRALSLLRYSQLLLLWAQARNNSSSSAILSLRSSLMYTTTKPRERLRDFYWLAAVKEISSVIRDGSCDLWALMLLDRRLDLYLPSPNSSHLNQLFLVQLHQNRYFHCAFTSIELSCWSKSRCIAIFLFPLQISHFYLPRLLPERRCENNKNIVQNIGSDYMLRQPTVQIELEVDSENSVRTKSLQIIPPLTSVLLCNYRFNKSKRK